LSISLRYDLQAMVLIWVSLCDSMNALTHYEPVIYRGILISTRELYCIFMFFLYAYNNFLFKCVPRYAIADKARAVNNIVTFMFTSYQIINL